MCGIVGFAGPLDPQQGEHALLALGHRGPDDGGRYYDAPNRVWLGHRRLAIIDLDGGKQPLSNADEQLWVTFNGCIYNYVELRDRLSAKGYVFRTQSDTEVIVHAYAEYGEDCVQHFNGMFAFALWDARRQRLFCARDRMGEKPFYYWHQGDTLIFASEIKALLATGAVPHSPDTDALQEYLTFQLILDDKTLFQGIRKLMPGQTLTYHPGNGTLQTRCYWDLAFQWQEDRPEIEVVDTLQTLLEDAIRLRLRADVPVGTHLSGGLDSSLVTCLAAGMLKDTQHIHSFTGAFREGPAFDETRYARIVARHAQTQNHEIYPAAEDFLATLNRIIYHMDEPAAGPGVFPQFMVARHAAQHVKVVLGGQGGDEIFAGYARYLVCYLENALKGCIMGGQPQSHYTQVLASLAPNLAMLEQYVPMLKSLWSDGLFEPQERRYFRLMDRSASNQGLFNPALFQDTGTRMFDAFNRIFQGSNAQSFLDRMLYFDLKVHLPALLHVEDRTSMAWGLESRVPLLDHRIAELMATVPPVQKFKGGQPKALFRQAIEHWVPTEIFQRQDKMGFPVPLSQWFQGDLQNFVRDILLDERARQRGLFNHQALERAITQEQAFGRATWGALCLELWFRTFIDQKPPVDGHPGAHAIPSAPSVHSAL